MLYWFAMFLLLVFPVLLFFTYILHKGKSCHSLPSPPGLPLIGHLHQLGPLPHRTLHKLSQSYGPIIQVRLGLVPAVVVSTAEMAEWFLKTHDAIFASRPTLQAAEIISYGKGLGFSKYGAYWRMLRRLCNLHLLSAPKVDLYRDLRQKEIRGLVVDLRAAAGCHQVVNLSARVGTLVGKITHQMILGSGKNQVFNLIPCVQEVLKIGAAFNIADFVPFAKKMDLQGLKRRMKDVSKTIDDLLEILIHERQQDDVQQQQHRKDFIDIMVSLMKSDTTIEEEKLGKTNIKAILIDMLVGSTDTTATTIEWALTELLRHPEVMKKVQDELLNVIGLGRMVEESDLKNLSYLNMVVKESMRLHPTLPLLVPHESTEDVSVRGYYIPKATRVIINAWAIGRDKNAWTDSAEEFLPERFINTDIDVRGSNIQLIPFGAGRRKCPGMEMAIRITHFVLAQVLHCFNLELPDGMPPNDVDMEEKFGMTVPRDSPLLAVPIYRLHVNNM